MSKALFVSNGHGEVAIAERIARELPGTIACDHLALVGDFAHLSVMRDVGPRRAMPSGGLIAMGNVRNIARDVAAGLLGHTLAQLRYLSGVRGTYDAAVAVGDVFALMMTLRAKARATVYVGTAKSVYVAPYGAMEERVLRKARAVFVRDAATARRLQQRGVAARPGNVIVDLYDVREEPALRDGFTPYLALFPGSRDSAYADAADLCAMMQALAHVRPHAGAALSIAPGLDAQRMAAVLSAGGLEVRWLDEPQRPFSLYRSGRELVRAWQGPLGAMLGGADAVLGQAGTANEAAAAGGIPVVALERSGPRAWYRKRQMGLLGDALLLLSGPPEEAAAELNRLLEDAGRRAHMAQTGRERMGPPGAAAQIAEEVVRLCG